MDKACQCKNCLKSLLIEPCPINVVMKLNVKMGQEIQEYKSLLKRIYDHYGRTSAISVDHLKEIGFMLGVKSA